MEERQNGAHSPIIEVMISDLEVHEVFPRAVNSTVQLRVTNTASVSTLLRLYRGGRPVRLMVVED